MSLIFISIYLTCFLSVNAECQANAGKAECGTFCLPTSTGHVCACQEDYYLLPDEKTCDNGQNTFLQFRGSNTFLKDANYVKIILSSFLKSDIV